jgi:hypothetical protein
LRATFFPQSALYLTSEEPNNATPEDLKTEPVVVALGNFGNGESHKTPFKRISRRTYDCRITAILTGSRAYLAKEYNEAEVGTLVQVEVLETDTFNRVKNLYSQFLEDFVSALWNTCTGRSSDPQL